MSTRTVPGVVLPGQEPSPLQDSRALGAEFAERRTLRRHAAGVGGLQVQFAQPRVSRQE